MVSWWREGALWASLHQETSSPTATLFRLEERVKGEGAGRARSPFLHLTNYFVTSRSQLWVGGRGPLGPSPHPKLSDLEVTKIRLGRKSSFPPSFLMAGCFKIIPCTHGGLWSVTCWRRSSEWSSGDVVKFWRARPSFPFPYFNMSWGNKYLE